MTAQPADPVPDKYCHFCFVYLPDARRIGMRSANGRHVACKACAVGLNFDRDTWRAISRGEANRAAKRGNKR